MKAIFLFFSLLGFCFLEVEGQVPNLPLSFTNEEVRKFRDKIKPCILPTPSKKAYNHFSMRMIPSSFVNIDLQRDAEVFDVDSGSLYIYKLYYHPGGFIQIFFEDFFISELSNLQIYSPEYIKETHNYYSNSNNPSPQLKLDYLFKENITDCNKHKIYYYPKIERALFYNFLILELFESNKDCLDSKIIIDSLLGL